MEVMLNDESINGQFTKESFIDYLIKEVIPILKLLEEQKINLLKSYETYNRKCTSNRTFEDILHDNHTAITRLKSVLVQLTRDPFWNENVETDMDAMYSCEGYDMCDIPNAITEALAREDPVFSFKDGGFDEENIVVTYNGNNVYIKNFYSLCLLEKHLKDLGLIERWESNSFLIESLGYKFEIRLSENNHSRPHFHLSNADDKISISIPDLDILAGSLSNQKVAISWARNNMDKIIELWNEIHPEKMVKSYKININLIKQVT